MLKSLSASIGKANIRVSDLFTVAVTDASVLWRPVGSLFVVSGVGECAVALWEMPPMAAANVGPSA